MSESAGGAEPERALRAAPVAEIAYFTDPLCSWSWAFEPQWRRLRFEFGDRLSWRYRMGGMIPDWSRFSDPLNAVSRPAQMAPAWYHVGQVSGMPIDERIWLEDPPGSSYPASIAVKAAGQQSAEAAERLLRRLRQAVMMDRRNVARRDVILQVADELAAAWPDGFDAARFRRDLDGGGAVHAFREDVKEARYLGIGRFPALIVSRPGCPGILIVGYRPYDALRAALLHVADVGDGRAPGSEAEYRAHWGSLTPRELAEVFVTEKSQTEAAQAS